MTPPVGVCPKNLAGHVWASWKVDDRKPCVHCGTPGRGEGGFFEKSTRARAELFQNLRAPLSAHGQKR